MTDAAPPRSDQPPGSSLAREPFEAFCVEVDALHREWTIWDHLFRGGSLADPGEEVMNNVLSSFFGVVYFALLSEVVLRLCRLTDPKGSGDRWNLTIERVVDETFGEPADDEQARLREQWRPRIQDARDRVEERVGRFRAHRDKMFAHNDLEVATRTRMLGGIAIDDVRIAVESVVSLKHRMMTCRAAEPLNIQAAAEEPGSLYPSARIEDPWRAEVDRLVEVLRKGLEAGD